MKPNDTKAKLGQISRTDLLALPLGGLIYWREFDGRHDVVQFSLAIVLSLSMALLCLFPRILTFPFGSFLCRKTEIICDNGTTTDTPIASVVDDLESAFPCIW